MHNSLRVLPFAPQTLPQSYIINSEIIIMTDIVCTRLCGHMTSVKDEYVHFTCNELKICKCNAMHYAKYKYAKQNIPLL